MKNMKPNTDIQPVSEFRARAAELIEQVRSTHRPVILTQRGRSTAVLLDVRDYESLIERMELLEDADSANRQIKAGRAVSNSKAKAQLRSRFKI